MPDNAETPQQRNARLRRAYNWASNHGTQSGPPPADIAEFFFSGTTHDGDAGESQRWLMKPEYQQEFVNADDPRVAAWLAQNGGERNFLDENGQVIAQDDGEGRYVISAEYRYEDLAQDPDFVGFLPDGRAIFDRNNAQSWEVDDRQRAEETSDRRSRQQYIRMIAMMAAGPLLQGFGMIPAGTGAELAAAPGQGFGTALGTGDALSAIGSIPSGTSGSELDVLAGGEHLTYNTPDYVPPGGPPGGPSPSGPGTEQIVVEAPRLPPTADVPPVVPPPSGGSTPGEIDPVVTEGEEMTFLEEPLGPPWWQRALNALADMPSIPGGPPSGGPGGGGGGGNGGGSGSLSMGGGSGGSHPFDLTEMNPYAKQKLTTVDALMAYLKGMGQQ